MCEKHWCLWQAYECLSQDAKRAEFNLERRSSRCIECYRTPCATSNHLATTRGFLPRERSGQKTRQGFKDLRTRFSEEIQVIENCLRANKASTKEFPIFNTRKEHPIFNPSDYHFQGYPHQRTERFTRSPRAFTTWRQRHNQMARWGNLTPQSLNLDPHLDHWSPNFLISVCRPNLLISVSLEQRIPYTRLMFMSFLVQQSSIWHRTIMMHYTQIYIYIYFFG